MKSIVRKPVMNMETGFVELKDASVDDIKLNEECILSIDGSTTCSGVSILNKQGLIMYSLAFKRTKDGETPVQYKVRFKREIEKILLNNKCIKEVFYEEPFWGYAESAKVLMMLRTSVEELIEENSPNLSYIHLTEVSNKRWKKHFLAPDPCPSSSEKEKEAVRVKLVQMLPVLEGVTQDEMDAAAMGFVALWHLDAHKERTLESRKKAKSFAYNVKFIGADTEEDMLNELGFMLKEWKIPEKLLDGIELYEIPGKGNFDDYVYNGIGEDDQLVVLSFSSKHHGNIILKHRIGSLASQYERIYAVCWRKTRKK